MLIMAVGKLDAILRGQRVQAVKRNTPETKRTLGLFRFRVGADCWGGGGGVAGSTAQHHPAIRRLAFGSGFLGMADEVAACADAVGVDGFH